MNCKGHETLGQLFSWYQLLWFHWSPVQPCGGALGKKLLLKVMFYVKAQDFHPRDLYS